MAEPKPRRPASLGAALWRLAGFWGNRSGNIAMMFGIAAIPFFAFGGLAVDFSRAMMVKNRLGAALDATALAVGGQTGLTEAQLTASANAFFDANYPDNETGRPTALRITYGARDVTIEADATVDTLIMGIIGYDELTVSAAAQVKRSSNSLEIAMVLDVTGSMSGTKIADLKAAAIDLVNIVIWADQSQYTSEVALVPFSNSVNLGANAAAVRGPVTPAKTITAASWSTGTAKTITGANKAATITITSASHGFVNGDTVWISGVGGMTQLNNKAYTVANRTTNNFQLSGVNSTGYSTFTSGGTIRKCQVAGCAVVVTSAAHGFANGAKVVITGVNGMTQINSAANTTWTVANQTANTFALSGSVGPNYSAYTSGGSIWCTVQGCQYLAFTAADSSARVHTISTCVSERTGAQAYTDAAPSTSFLGRVYPPASGNTCLANQVVPMTSNITTLTTAINAMAAVGSTAGQIGTAWGWYMVSPNFAYLWPAASQPQAYGTDELLKIAVIMTDGAYNTPYCSGVIAADAASGSGSASDHINCNATNGDPFVQAATQCEAMKDAGVIVYTVGFDIDSSPDLIQLLSDCASDTNHAFVATDGAALRAAFRAIAVDISNLRLSQ
jgi:Flp pilus assembly protein TadG